MFCRCILCKNTDSEVVQPAKCGKTWLQFRCNHALFIISKFAINVRMMVAPSHSGASMGRSIHAFSITSKSDLDKVRQMITTHNQLSKSGSMEVGETFCGCCEHRVKVVDVPYLCVKSGEGCNLTSEWIRKNCLVDIQVLYPFLKPPD